MKIPERAESPFLEYADDDRQLHHYLESVNQRGFGVKLLWKQSGNMYELGLIRIIGSSAYRVVLQQDSADRWM